MRPLVTTLLILIAFILTACSSQPEQTSKSPSIDTNNDTQSQARTLLLEAWQSTSLEESSKLRLRATWLLLQDDEVEQASAVYKLIDADYLTGRQGKYFVKVGLLLAKASQDPMIAQIALQRDTSNLFTTLPLDEKINLIALKLEAFDSLGRHAEAALLRIESASMFTDEAYWSNHENIWTSLTQTETSELVTLNTPTPGDFELAGWLDLAINIKQNEYNLDEQLSALTQWQQNWPGHPVTRKLPEELLLLSTLPETRPANIVLALPLSGPLSNAGRAVQEGFMAAYYNDPFRNKNATEITVIDTANVENFADNYLEHTISGPDLVIGPLKKENVNALTAIRELPTPILALNYSDEEQLAPENLFQFGLSNEDEIRQLTEHLWAKGMRHIIAVCPENEWGWRSCEQVRKDWEQKNGIVLETVYFDPKGEHTKLIETTFKVDESVSRANALSREIQETVELTPRRRQDVDAIVLLSRPKNARRIKPLLAFFYAGDLPVFSTSSIYSGQVDNIKDQDLNGVIFTDIPWILNRTNDLKSTIHKKQSKLATHYDRLFALGADAYLLAPRVTMFKKLKTAAINGNTGLLKMEANGVIYRTLDWAVFIDGEAKPVSGI